MKIGFTIYPNRLQDMGALCRHAEGLGFDSVWVGEHVVMPVEAASAHPYGGRSRPPVLPSDERFYDVWTAVAAILATTERLAVATGIYLLPLRNPLLTARAAISAQRLGQGRFLFGVGIGWLAEEFAALGVPFAERAPRFEELVAIMRALFAGGEVAHAGRFYQFPRLQMTAVDAGIPILFGGTKPGAIRRAALLADGWYGTTIPLEESIAIKMAITRHRAAAGLGDDFAFHARILGSPDRATMDGYRAAGFDTAVITWDALHSEDPRATTLDFKLAALERCARGLGLSRS